MKTTIITFKALSYDGRIVRKNIGINHEFEVIPPEVWNGIELPATSIEEQVMRQLDESDKTQIMTDNEFSIIIDYWPKKPRKRRTDEINDFINYCKPLIEAYPNLKRPIEAIISESKDTLFGKGKSNKTKLTEVMKMHELILKGSEGLLNILNEKLKNVSNHKKETTNLMSC